MRMNDKTCFEPGRSVFRRPDNLEMKILVIEPNGMSMRLLCRYDEDGKTHETWFSALEVWSKPNGKWYS